MRRPWPEGHWRSEEEEKPQFWKSRRHARACDPVLQRTLKSTNGRIQNPATLERDPLRSSMPRLARKIKTARLLAPNLSLSLVPLFFLQLSLSLFFPQISHIWYFYHLLPPFVPTHFLSAMLLAFLPIDFPIKTSKGSYGKSWEETQALPHILFRSLILKGKS